MTLYSGTAPVIYNLFPRYFDSIEAWHDAIPHIVEMGFNTVFINPVHECGFSGSMYAVKDYYRLDRKIIGPDADPGDWRAFRNFTAACDDQGICVCVDLVINHTAIDSVLVSRCPQWYRYDEQGEIVRPGAIDPANADNSVVWGDLAEIDNEHSSDRERLWQFWDRLVAFFQGMGVTAFRCDAAYKVPAPLWRWLIEKTRLRDSGTLFLAESLGCLPEQVTALRGCGFDYLFNSSKWWHFNEPWCLEQHARYARIAPSISFPESHDTERLASLPPGTIAAHKQRYLFAAVFSRGVLMPMGFEYGARTRIDVVHGSLGDSDEPQWDLSDWIGQVNRLKQDIPVIAAEGAWTLLNTWDASVVALRKRLKGGEGSMVILVNRVEESSATFAFSSLKPGAVPSRRRWIRPCAGSFRPVPCPGTVTLDPLEIACILK